MKSWTASMSLVTRVMQVAGARFAVFGEREALNPLIQQQPQIVRHPLADAGRQIFLDVGADAADDRDHHHRGEREIQSIAAWFSPNSETTAAPSGRDNRLP